MDILHAVAASAFALACVAALAVSRELNGKERRFAKLLAAGCGLLAAEKVLRLADRAHEALHRAGLGDPPYLNGLDDLFMLTGFMAAAAGLLWATPVLRASLATTRWLAIAGLMAIGSFAIDAFGPHGGTLPLAEELLEAAMGLALIGGALALRQPEVAASKQRPAVAMASRRD